MWKTERIYLLEESKMPQERTHSKDDGADVCKNGGMVMNTRSSITTVFVDSYLSLGRVNERADINKAIKESNTTQGDTLAGQLMWESVARTVLRGLWKQKAHTYTDLGTQRQPQASAGSLGGRLPYPC